MGSHLSFQNNNERSFSLITLANMITNKARYESSITTYDLILRVKYGGDSPYQQPLYIDFEVSQCRNNEIMGAIISRANKLKPKFQNPYIEFYIYIINIVDELEIVYSEKHKLS